ncbi:heterokaryon incompatibility protein het-E-1, partial [Podospora aff. communis PSN243]
MRLIHVDDFEMVTVASAEEAAAIEYAILSHTWGDEEVTYQDFISHDPQDRDGSSNKGFNKILACCAQARRDGIQLVWIDTCCIDKTNSVELSEAINSMYSWYWHSTVCYAYLEDVEPATHGDNISKSSSFRQARWFSRGWCLQELIAPSKVEFYARDWSDIGTKWSLREKITEITGIPGEVLLTRHLKKYSIAQKMSWAAERETTRIEDLSYCLLGIFDVNMPLLYGEGERAFTRLQKEMIARGEDSSFLLWTSGYFKGFRITDSKKGKTCAVLALHPNDFPRDGLRHAQDSEQSPLSYEEILRVDPSSLLAAQNVDNLMAWTDRRPPQLTSRGLHVKMFMGKVGPGEWEGRECRLLWTGCTYRGLNICVQIIMSASADWTVVYERACTDRVWLIDTNSFAKFQVCEIYLATDNRRDPHLDSITFRDKLLRAFPETDIDLFLTSKGTAKLKLEKSSLP